MSEEYEMDDTTAGATAAGTAADDPPSRQRSDQDRRPSVPGRFSPSIQTSGYYNREKVSLKDALAQISPSELDAVPTSTDSVEDFDELLASLESDDEKEVSVEDEIRTVGEARAIPSVLLETSPNHGLDDAEVLSRRKRYGWNMMKEEKRSHLKTFLMFFVGPIQCVMLLAFVLAAGLRDWIDMGVIAGLLLLNAVVGFVQDYQAGNIVNELKKTLAQNCTVLRNGGILAKLDVLSLVPGDIVHLDEGTIVPADGLLITSEARLQVDQSSVTGESLAVRKEISETVYQSSTIKRGEGYMMVTAIGDSTFVGRSATLVNAAAAGVGHFTQVLRGIGSALLVLVVVTLFVVWVASFYRSNPIVQILTFTLAITIIGVPVGLPAVVTTTMAVGAAFLAKKRAIVQRLSAIESLAGVEILCSDKTGTLTKNKLSLGEPYTVQGIDPSELMLTACLAASHKKRGIDAIDKAFLKATKLYPRVKDMLRDFQVVEFIPFDPVSKKVTAIVQSTQGERIVCVKGAPPTVMRMVLEAGPLPEEMIRQYNEKVAEFASRGFRSLGVARKPGAGPWQLLGIMPCSDPPRHDTAKTIREAIDLGLKIKMLTGDAVGIAKETSRQLGLGENVYNSERLGLGGGGDMPGSAIYDFVEAADGFAEVFPQHKYNVVGILQQRGHLVAMTGDGVNDAPSLKKADTGIAVEGSSDAARSAADIVFLAPGLSAIIDAIKTSRQIFHRMHAYVVYRIALSLHMDLFLGLWIAVLNDSLKIQLVVFIAIFADIATLAIAYDKAPFSRTPVKWNLPKLWGMSIIMGLILAGASFICLTTMVLAPTVDGIVMGGIAEKYGKRDSILFLEIALSENWLIFITRADGPFWTSWPSWQLILAVLTVDAVATLFCVFGLLNGGQIMPVRHLVTTARVWVFSFGVFCLMAGVYYLLNDFVAFDRMMHGKWPCKRKDRNKNMEDLGMLLPELMCIVRGASADYCGTGTAFALDRLSRQHDKAV